MGRKKKESELLYTYKERVYVAYSGTASMQIGQVWMPCIVYFDRQMPDRLFVREYNDFIEKFKPLLPDGDTQ